MTRTSLALCAFFAILGCQDTSPLFECELSCPDGKEEPPLLECPRQTPVRLDRTVEEGTTCVYDANVHTILCDDGTRIDAETGQFLEEPVLEQDQGDMQGEDGTKEPDDMGGDMHFPGEGALLGGELARGLYTHGSCSVLGNTVVCTDGLTATLPNVLDPLAIMCETRLLRGYGRRIICWDEDDGLAVIVPDGESEAVPMCEAQSHVVHCEDGTTFGAGGRGLETSEGGAIEACENPRLVQDAPPEVVARCLESIQDCEACTLTSSCERALTPVLLCNEEEVIEVINGDTCYPADGMYTIASRQEADVLKERACTVIVGDVLFDTGDDLDAPEVDVLWLDALSSTTSIQGSLFIKNADVRDQDVIAYDELLQALVLESVGGDVSWEGQRGINYLDWPAAWTHIGGQLRIASWNVLQRIVLPPPTQDDVTRFIGADWAIQGNPQLEEFDVAYTEVRGSLVLAENTMFQGCSLYRAIQWAYGWASGVVLITATFGEPRKAASSIDEIYESQEDKVRAMMTTKKMTCLALILCVSCTEDEPNTYTEDQASCTLLEQEDTSSTRVLQCGEDTITVRNGVDGLDGMPGPQGKPGTDGMNGIDGNNGMDGERGEGFLYRETRLGPQDQACAKGGTRIEVLDAESQDVLSQHIRCDEQCSAGELYEADFDQCIKFVQIEFEGSLWRMQGDFPEIYAPSFLDADEILGVDGTPCTGTLIYPFAQEALARDEFAAQYAFGEYAYAGLTLTIGDRTYRRDPSVERLPKLASMVREAYPIFGNVGQLEVTVRQHAIEGVPNGYMGELVLNAGDSELPFEEAEAGLASPNRAVDWFTFQDELIESVSIDVIEDGSASRARLVCRLTHFE